MRKHARLTSVPTLLMLAAVMLAVQLFTTVPAASGHARRASVRNTAPPTEDNFRRLRECESGGDYDADTGNGYFGAYQFSESTWRGLGLSGMPHLAEPATQDEAARQLQSLRGWHPWPGCARRLRL